MLGAFYVQEREFEERRQRCAANEVDDDAGLVAAGLRSPGETFLPFGFRRRVKVALVDEQRKLAIVLVIALDSPNRNRVTA